MTNDSIKANAIIIGVCTLLAAPGLRAIPSSALAAALPCPMAPPKAPKPMAKPAAKAKEEMTYAEEFDQIIINDDLETAQKEIERIVRNFIEE